MTTKNPNVDVYFTAGCGRCALMNTPECKVHNWDDELRILREIVLDCGLDEELKWGHPCYTSRGKNIVLIGAFKNDRVLSFFKGALLADAAKILSKPGENSQAGRVVRFTGAQKIIESKFVLQDYIREAVEAEQVDLKVPVKEVSKFKMPDELQGKFNENPDLKTAFERLTPGRQRGYLFYFSQSNSRQPASQESKNAFREFLSAKA